MSEFFPSWTWTVSKVNNYNVCPFRAYRCDYAPKGERIPFKETAATRFGNQEHLALEVRIRMKKPLPERLKRVEPLIQAYEAKFAGQVLQAELQLALDQTLTKPTGYIRDKRTWWRGKGDVVGLDLNSGGAFIGDWKTGKPKEDDFQLAMLGLGIFARYPEIDRVLPQFMYLRYDPKKTMCQGVKVVGDKLYRRSDVPAMIQDAKERASYIQFSLESGRWDKVEGPLCCWCPVKECEFWRGEQGCN